MRGGEVAISRDFHSCHLYLAHPYPNIFFFFFFFVFLIFLFFLLCSVFFRFLTYLSVDDDNLEKVLDRWNHISFHRCSLRGSIFIRLVSKKYRLLLLLLDQIRRVGGSRFVSGFACCLLELCRNSCTQKIRDLVWLEKLN